MQLLTVFREGEEILTAPIDDASVSMSMVHYANIAYRINKGFDINNKGKMLDDQAKKTMRTSISAWLGNKDITGSFFGT